jgi:hypothetical protein
MPAGRCSQFQTRHSAPETAERQTAETIEKPTAPAGVENLRWATRCGGSLAITRAM